MDDCVSASVSEASSKGTLLEAEAVAAGGATVKRVDAQGMARMYACLWGLASNSCARPQRYAEGI